MCILLFSNALTSNLYRCLYRTFGEHLLDRHFDLMVVGFELTRASSSLRPSRGQTVVNRPSLLLRFRLELERLFQELKVDLLFFSFFLSVSQS